MQQLTKACPHCAETIQNAAIVCKHCGRDLFRPFPSERRYSRRRQASDDSISWVFAVCIGLVALGLGVYKMMHTEQILAAVEAHMPIPRPPLVLYLPDQDALTIQAGSYGQFDFTINDERPCLLTGRVVGLAGGRKDAEVFLLDDDGLTNWLNRTQGNYVFRSGRTSATTLKVALPGPGSYHMLLSNRFSVVSDKVMQMRNLRVTCE